MLEGFVRVGAVLAAVVALAGGALSVGGCGGSDAAERSGATVSLSVTRDFGREVLVSARDAPLPEPARVLRLARDHADVVTSDGERIEAIEGARRIDRGDTRTTWALIVNGIEADLGPEEYPLGDGDVVQLDLRDWYVTLDVRATVGAFPETFTRGSFGRRFPTTVECAQPRSKSCRLVRRALERAGVAVDGSRPPGRRPQGITVHRARVLVGPWRHWRDRPWPGRIDEGARWSGVFAKFSSDLAALRLLDWDARTVRSVGAGSGLVAAQRPTEEDLVWFVTGVDAEGVERAAAALDSAALRDAFALVVTREGPIRVPIPHTDPFGPRDREGS